MGYSGVWAFLFFVFIFICFLLLPVWLEHVGYNKLVGIFERGHALLGYGEAAGAAALAIVAWLRRHDIQAFFQRAAFCDLGKEIGQLEDQVEGLIIPVSRRQQPEWLIRHLRPAIVGLLYTSRSRKEAADLARDFGGQGAVRVFPSAAEIERSQDVIEAAERPELTRDRTVRYIRRLVADGLDRKRIFVDVTGGTVPMSIGAFQAAESEGVSTIYVWGTKDGRIEDPKDVAHGRPIYISNRST